VVVADSLGSAGLLGLSAAELDPITFKIVLALTTFCVAVFLAPIIWSAAENLVERHSKSSKSLRDVLSDHWKRTMGLLPFRAAIEIWRRILYLAILVWHRLVDIMGRLDELVKLHLLHRRGHSTLIPMAVVSSWRIVGAFAIGSTEDSDIELEAVYELERRVVDYKAVQVTQVEKGKNAADFWQQPHDAEGVHLNVIKTHAHVGSIR